MSTTSARLIYRPTPAAVRAVLLAVVASALALVLGKPALLVLAAPFVVWSIWAVLQRPTPDEDAPALEASARTISLGESVAVAVRSGGAGAPQRLVDVAIAPDAGVDLDPEWGAACGLDEAVVKLRPRRWGRLDLPSAHVTVSDPWNLWAAELRLSAGSVDVSPVSTVPGRGDALPHPTGTAGIHQSRRAGDGTALADIRRFAPGDRLNRINWRVTSRTGELHTNATTADRDTDVLIVVDTLADITTAEIGGEHESSLDRTIVAAASLTEHYLRLGDRVGVHDLGGVVGSLPARSGIRQFAAFTAGLARVRPQVPRDHGVRAVGRLRAGTFVVVCTPLLDAAVLREIAVLSRRGAAVLVVDTLPGRLGRLDRGPLDRSASPLRRLLDPAPAASFWEEAWVLRRLQRDADVAHLREVGIPVTEWGGVSGIAALAAALTAQRPVARAGGSLR